MSKLDNFLFTDFNGLADGQVSKLGHFPLKGDKWIGWNARKLVEILKWWKAFQFSRSRLLVFVFQVINVSHIRYLIWIHPSRLHGHSTQKQVMPLNKQLKQNRSCFKRRRINFTFLGEILNYLLFWYVSILLWTFKTRPCKFCSRQCNGPKVHLTFQGLI